MTKQYEWLPHLVNSMTDETMGYSASPYSIALEGWRRGLELSIIKTKRKGMGLATFELSDGQDKYRFFSTRGNLVTKEAVRICINKYETKKYLEKANVLTPKGESFDDTIENNEIISYANNVGYPLVIKPIDGTGGDGVIANIRNSADFEKSLIYIREDLNYKNIIVEEHFQGEDYRIYVVDNKAIAATKRIPPNVIGDGKSTIETLIKKKNRERIEMKFYRSSLIKVDKELKNYLNENNLNLNSIPQNGERIYLKSKNNVTAGGDPVDATDELSEEVKQIAVSALNAIPGLPQGGVDIMVNHESNVATIIEINSRAHIRLNLFPLEGKGRDIPKAIIDYYFPNTKQNLKSPLYFDFGKVWKELQEGDSKKIKVDNHPSGELKLTRYMLEGDLMLGNFNNKMKQLMLESDLQGYVKYITDDKVSIVVCGGDHGIKKYYDTLNNYLIKLGTQYKIEEHKRKTPIPVGFLIINNRQKNRPELGYFPVRVKDTRKKTNDNFKINKTQRKDRINSKAKKEPVKKSKSKINKNNKSTIDYEKEYKKLINSHSWRLTKPLRVIKSKLKGK